MLQYASQIVPQPARSIKVVRLFGNHILIARYSLSLEFSMCLKVPLEFPDCNPKID